MEKAKNYDVYIIYRRKDRDAARLIAQLLQSTGKSVFFDMEVLSGGDFSKQISSGLESSQSYMVLLSEGCMDKCVHSEDWWTKEVEHAVQSGKKIIPINIEASFKSDGLKDLPEVVMSLLKIQWMPFYFDQTDRFVNNVLSLLDSQISNGHKEERNIERMTADKLLEEYTPYHIDYDIFISYRRDDAREHARNVQLALRSSGYEKVFFDYDSIQDGEFTKRIINAIFSCTDFLLLLSPKSMERCVNQGDPMAYEIRAAIKYKKHIIPMKLYGKDIIWPKDFPADLEYIKSIQWHDHMTNSYFDESIKKLIFRLKTKKQTPPIPDKLHDSIELQIARVNYIKGNFIDALRSFLLEEEKGSVNALNDLGLFYYEGKACPPNYQQAISYFQKAADMGNTSAMCNLGDCYKSGHGVKQNVKKFVLWYEKAAEKKDSRAYPILARFYHYVDPIKATYYYSLIDNLSDIPYIGDCCAPCAPPANNLLKDDIVIIEVGGLQLEMVRVQGGQLEIGATEIQKTYAESNEYPAFEIILNTYYISKYPITQDIWEYVMGYNKSHFGLKGDSVSAKLPAEQLTHDEAIEFTCRLSEITKMPFSLPTEEEWEYAAQGGQKSKHYMYSGSNDIDEVAWYRGNAGRTTHPVGEKKPNELGIYDMCGNVWEWTETPAHPYGLHASSGGNVYIRRGGSWWHEAKNCRVSCRYPSDHSKKTSGLGLRVVIRKNVE